MSDEIITVRQWERADAMRHLPGIYSWALAPATQD
jgi:hypothetical protein